jgi:YD repeat-containing protein
MKTSKKANVPLVESELKRHFRNEPLHDLITASRGFPPTARVDLQLALDKMFSELANARLIEVHSHFGQHMNMPLTIAHLLGSQHFQGLGMECSYTYDADDRVIRRLTQMGDFKGEESKTFNEQGDEDWTLMIRNGIDDEREEFRYLYQYDSHGNWTERTTVNADNTGNPNTQRRTLAYY